MRDKIMITIWAVSLVVTAMSVWTIAPKEKTVYKEQPKAQINKHWYGEYCGIGGSYCEFRDDKGESCPFQLNDKDPLDSIDLRLKDGSCKIL